MTWTDASRWADDQERLVWGPSARAFEVSIGGHVARLCRPCTDNKRWYFTYEPLSHFYCDMGVSLVAAKRKAELLVESFTGSPKVTDRR